MEIYNTNDSFDFNKLILTNPTPMPGGNYFIKCLVDKYSLYIQPPKCKTKQGIIKASKRFYTDLMFSNENESFIRWMENLENHCQQTIYKNKEKWFNGELEMHDIENYFTSPLKIYKSGKYYIARTNITNVLGKPSLKIYDENEKEVDIESIGEDTNIMTILEIQGIKCSSKSFQIEIELKQMMVLQSSDIFEKCLIKPIHLETIQTEPIIDTNIDIDTDTDTDTNIDANIDANIEIFSDIEKNTEELQSLENIKPNIDIDNNELLEIDFHLEELKDTEPVSIKKRDNIYYEMYKEAKKKAKVARDLALSTYLEAKRIKNTYMLEDLEDEDEDDVDIDVEDEEDENEE